MLIVNFVFIMASIKIMEYDVEFPYPHPYDIQRAYMDKVIHCLHNKVHGVLESPTGTGKTLCLLAPVSAWIKKQKVKNAESIVSGYPSDNLMDYDKAFPPNKETTNWGDKKKSIVWYTARTHSQIAQTLTELRRCDIRGINVRVLGARDQLCINPEVLREEESYIKTLKCKELAKNKNCKYLRKLHQDKDPGKYYQPGEVLDIEDLVSVGKNCGVCPYYLSKATLEAADIVFLPYNYIIDRDSRDANGLHFQGDVVIFDEGHNVPATCEESYEFTLTSLDLALGIKNVKDLMMHLAKLSEIANDDEEMDIAKYADNSLFMVEALQKLEFGLEKMKVSEELKPVSTIYELFREAGIRQETANRMLDIISDFHSDSNRLNLSGSTLATFHLFEKILNIIFGSTIRSYEKEIVDRSFKCSIRIDPDKVNLCKRLSLYCFNPSFGIRNIIQLGVQSIILTSGTLSPLNTFIHELDLPNPVTLQNGHIAKQSQVPFLIVGTGVNNVRMNAAFTNRSNRDYIISLGRTLTNLVCSVPDGILILFSSYSMMQSLKEVWESDVGIWKRLNSLKRVFIEPRGKDEFINCMENYRRAIDSGNGAILMGVLRGKISEGMDFKDQYCRGVFIVGVPFPPTKDPRVKGKEKYSESLTIDDPSSKTKKKLYDNSFISVEAMKATNQAIGRVIRHGQDYGAIILLDYRFCWPKLFDNISGWLRGTKAVERNFPQAKKILSEFFRELHSGKLGVPEVRCQRVDGNGCPVADYVTYEEYEHKKAVRAPVPWITANTVQRKLTSDIIQKNDESLQNVASLYDSGFTETSEASIKKQSSVFEAMESLKSEFPGYGEKNTGNSGGSGEGSKRKFDEGLSETSIISNSESKTEKAQAKKIARFKIKPFSKSEGGEPESIVETENFMDNYVDNIRPFSNSEKRKTNENEAALKIKLVNYFKSAKSILNEGEEREFKRISFKYMKGEKILSDVLVFLDKIFNTRDRKHLYSGFSVCIKTKDREEWSKACEKRNIQESLS